jgi:hypothetical protein
MPYLPKDGAIELDVAAIVPKNDPRMETLRKQAPAIDLLVNGFGYSKKYPGPCFSFLIKEGKVPLKSVWEATADLRNLVALSCVSAGWQDTVPGPNCSGTLYSDYFDFYPTLPTKDGEGYTILSPALNSYDDSSSEFQGYTPPDLPNNSFMNRARPDKDFIEKLIVC